jgi:aldose 1-epimerase
MTMAPLELRAGDLRLALRPDLGGCIAGLWLADTAVLRSTEPTELTAASLSGCYPLVPYSNRIGHCRFRWQGQDHRTELNYKDKQHSLHGVGWQRPWSVLSSHAGQAELELTHLPDAHWPFAFTARQRFVLTPQALRVELQVTNQDTQAQPVGLGWHPYFPKRAQSHLDIDVSTRWDNDSVGLATHQAPQAAIHQAVGELSFDNCFGGWTGAARIRDEHLDMQLTSSASRLVVFTPQDKPYYCVEPVTHVSNAIQMADPAAHGLQTVEPGGTHQTWMNLELARA